MNKITKGLMLSVIVAAALLTTNEVYAQTDIVTNDQVETVQVTALSAAIVGSVISVVVGYTERPDGQGFSIKKLLSAIITSVMGSMLLVNLGAIPAETNGMTIVGIFISYLILGYGADKGLARLDKN